MNGSGEHLTNVNINVDVGSAAEKSQISGIHFSKADKVVVLQTRKKTSKREPAKIPARSGIACLGREDLVVKVTAAFESQPSVLSSKPSSKPSVLLYGMLGIGKSSLADAAIMAL